MLHTLPFPDEPRADDGHAIGSDAALLAVTAIQFLAHPAGQRRRRGDDRSGLHRQPGSDRALRGGAKQLRNRRGGLPEFLRPRRGPRRARLLDQPSEPGIITVSEFFTFLDDGAAARTGSPRDAQTLQDQVDIGLYFAVINGLSDVSDATTTLALYDTADREGSLLEVKEQIDVLASEASALGTGEFLIQLIGVIDDPFV